MNDDKKLRPCPFCGGNGYIKPTLIFPNYGEFDPRNKPEEAYAIGCKSCGFSLLPNRSAEKAAEKWNRRYNQPARKLCLEELSNMDKKPVYIVAKTEQEEFKGWGLIDAGEKYIDVLDEGFFTWDTDKDVEEYGVVWVAYNQEPGTTL